MIWILGLLKSHALRGSAGDVATDDRLACSFEFMSTTLERIIHSLYPTLYNITEIERQPKGKEVSRVVF